MGIYFGTGDAPQKNVKDIYIGFNDKPRKISEAYVGINGKPVKIYPDSTFPAIGGKLNDYSWGDIAQIAEAGLAPEYFAVGDTKDIIPTAGKVGAWFEFNDKFNTQYYSQKMGARILGFDHNGSKNTIDFGLTSVLIDALYLSDNTAGIVDTSFRHNVLEPYSLGGWQASYLRYNILGSTNKNVMGDTNDAPSDTATNPVPNTLMARLPGDLRKVMKPITVYTNNASKTTVSSSSITATVDYLPLLSEFEVRGFTKLASPFEADRQQQYQYFSDGPDLEFFVCIGHESVGDLIDDLAVFWLRSPALPMANGTFCCVDLSGPDANPADADISCGICPIFRI